MSNNARISLSAAAERKLRPIYDQLDSGSNKNALHEADKVLKKQKDFAAAKVLKSIALQRLGRHDEAFSLAQLITQAEPTDENSLQGLTLYFREINRVDLIPPIYECALTKFPVNEEYATHLFMAYVRIGKLKEMQKTAMTLYKNFPKNPYLFWAIMTTVMQAVKDPKMGSAMFLPLAKRMVEKQMEKNAEQFEAAEIRLYLMILDLMSDYQKALEVLNKYGSKLVDFDGSLTKKIEFYKKLNKWERVNAESKTLLRKNSNVWNYALDYLDSLQHLVAGNCSSCENDELEGSSTEDADWTYESAFKYINEIVNQSVADDDSRKCRGPMLFRLEFRRRLTNATPTKGSAEVLEKLQLFVDLLSQYVEMFGSKQCCYSDISTYLSQLTISEVAQFLQTLRDKLHARNKEEVPSNNREEENKLQRDILLYQMERHCGVHDEYSNEKKLEMVKELLEKHKQGIAFSDDRPPTDYHTADEYCVIAGLVLFQMISSGNLESKEQARLLWRCVLMMEFAITKSPHNFRIKFMLIRAYNELGMFQPSAHVYDSLEVKHMQQDTIGYTVFHYVSALGHYQMASQAFETVRTYFVANKKDLIEFVIVCFKNGTFHKIIEFLSFQDKVGRSLTSALSITEHSFMDLVTQAEIQMPASQLLKSSTMPEELYDLENLSDNRDFKVIEDITPEAMSNMDGYIADSFSYEKTWVHFRDVSVRCMSRVLTGEFITKQNGGDTNHQISTDVSFSSLLAKLERIVEDINAALPKTFPLYGPPNSRMHVAMATQLPAVILKSLKICDNIGQAQTCNNDNNLSDQIMKLNDEISHILSESLNPISNGVKELSEPVHKSLLNFDDEDENEIAVVNQLISENCTHCDVTNAFSTDIPQVLIEFRKDEIERLVSTCEMYSVCVLLLHSVRSIVQNIKTDAMKKRRRKKGNQELMPRIIETYKSVISQMLEVGLTAESAVNKMLSKAETMTTDISLLAISDDIKSEEQNAVSILTQQASRSLRMSTLQLLRVVQGRINNLKAIKI